MTNWRLIFTICILYHSYTAIGQSGKNPTPDDIILAQTIKSLNPESQVVAKSIINHFEFEFNEASDRVVALEKNNHHLMALEHNARYQPYEFYDDMSSVISAGATYQNKKRTAINLQREKYSSQDFFHTDTKVAFFNLDFETKGFQYKIHFDKKYNDVKYLTSVYFHEDIPVLSKTLSFTIPSWLEVELKEINFEGYKVQKEINKEEDQTKYTFTIENLDPRISERNAPGASHIYPHILVLSKKYNRNGQETNLFNSTQDLYNWYSSLIDMMDDEVAPLNALVDQLTKDKSTDIEKVKSIYYWVQDNIRYIAFEDGIAGFKPDECQNVLEKKYGDCKGMANLCRQMLTLAGFDARLTWIGTKRIAYDYSLPTLSADNHMICVVMLDGQPYFLDPTESYGAFDEYAERIQGRQAMIADGDQYILHSVPVMSPADNLEQQTFNLTISDETLSGKAIHSFLGESKSTLLYQLNNTERDDQTERLKNYLNGGDKNYVVEELKHTNISNRDDAFQLNYDVRIENKVSRFGDEIYLSIDYYKEWQGATFEERKLDYLLPHKTKSLSTYTIEIPEGYKVSELPDNIEYNSSFLNIDAEYNIIGNKIIYTKVMELPKAEITTDEFEEFHKIIEKLTDFYDQQITLTKE